MSEQYTSDPLLDMFLFETTQLIEQLEQSVLESEQEGDYFSEGAINEIFRIMHTIKGSAAMMMFNNISMLAHTMEDIFFYLREDKPGVLDFSEILDLILNGVDFIKCEIDKIKNSKDADGDSSTLIHAMEQFLTELKEDNKPYDLKKEIGDIVTKKQDDLHDNQILDHTYCNAFRAVIFFEEDCEMENIRAYTVIRSLEAITDQISYVPQNILDNDKAAEVIQREGFQVFVKSDYTYEMMNDLLMQTTFLKKLELSQLDNEEVIESFNGENPSKSENQQDKVCEIVEPHKSDKDTCCKDMKAVSSSQSIISVSVAKLDRLMDLVGEMVISEAMVIQNPDLLGLQLDNFNKAARQLNKITTEMQDMVMSIRMVPLSATFSKMHRVVRDMCKKLDKDVKLEIAGDATEVDKNIIEHISDPLMHLVRNSVDHGIEAPDERLKKGKQKTGTVILEAKNSASDVLIIVKDDGRGLDRDKILKKAKENQLLIKSKNEMTDREVYNLILLPGFSTNDQITEFSGRGVGMDVVAKNIGAVGGSLYIDSIPHRGTEITLKIPLTLAIIDGMNIKVGDSCFTINEWDRIYPKAYVSIPDAYYCC